MTYRFTCETGSLGQDALHVLFLKDKKEIFFHDAKNMGLALHESGGYTTSCDVIKVFLKVRAVPRTMFYSLYISLAGKNEITIRHPHARYFVDCLGRILRQPDEVSPLLHESSLSMKYLSPMPPFPKSMMESILHVKKNQTVRFKGRRIAVPNGGAK